MFDIDSAKTIHITRGDIATIKFSAKFKTGNPYLFKENDIVRFTTVEKTHYESIILTQDVLVTADSEFVEVNLHESDTRIGDVINKPKDYWYEVTVNPDTAPQTIIGHDTAGPKIFRLYPEGDDSND